jgi:hypothetical protein
MTQMLKRQPQAMPVFVRTALKRHGLIARYNRRPAYQRNDYLGWINRAAREGTKAKRLAQMLDELKRGDVYMKMKWNSDRRP